MSKKRILLIDDDPTVAKIIEPFLVNHGYDLMIASDGEVAVDMVKQQRPDLIILDVQMPRMNGYTFILELKKIAGCEHLPIIVLTAKDGMSEIFKVEGAKEYLTKPVNNDRLIELIKRYI